MVYYAVHYARRVYRGPVRGGGGMRVLSPPPPLEFGDFKKREIDNLCITISPPWIKNPNEASGAHWCQAMRLTEIESTWHHNSTLDNE